MSFFMKTALRKVFDGKVTLLVGVGTLLIISGLSIIFSQVLLQEPQDIRRNAMVSDGTAELVLSPAPGSTIQNTADKKITISLNPHQVVYKKINLQFDVITNDVITSVAPTFNQASGLELAELNINTVDHGYTITLSAERSTPTQPPADGAIKLLDLGFDIKKDGQVNISFNKEKSVLVRTSDNADQLDVLETSTYTISKDGPTTDAASLDDLFFDPFNNETTKLTFKTADTGTEVNPGQMVPNKSYTVTHTSSVQNIKKSANAPEKSVNIQLKINDAVQTQGKLSYKTLSSKSGSETAQITGTFTAKEVNTFVFKLDPENTFAERAEDNNSWQKEVRTGGATGSSSVSIKQCNDICSNNSECSTGYRCYNTGSDRRCRLATNVTNSSCTGLPSQGISRSCNQYCADTRECAAGYTCWYNRCRLPTNVDSISCARPAEVNYVSATTKGGLPLVTTTFQSCNESCRSNRDCQAGLRCYQGSCRHPLNTASTVCSAETTTTTTTTPKPTASPKPSTSPNPSASPKATATPRPGSTTEPSPTPPQLTATPVASPDAALPTITPAATPLPPATSNESAFDMLALLFNSYLTNLESSPQYMGIPLPFLVIGLGVVFLILAILTYAFSGRKPKIETAPKLGLETEKVTVPVVQSSVHKPTTPITVQHNPPPPKEVLAQRETAHIPMHKTPVPSSVQSYQAPVPVKSQPIQVITKPAVTPPAATRPVYTPAIQNAATSSAPTATITTTRFAPAVIPPVAPPAVVEPVQPPAVVPQPPTSSDTGKLSMAERLKQKGIGVNPTTQK